MIFNITFLFDSEYFHLGRSNKSRVSRPTELTYRSERRRVCDKTEGPIPVQFAVELGDVKAPAVADPWIGLIIAMLEMPSTIWVFIYF